MGIKLKIASIGSWLKSRVSSRQTSQMTIMFADVCKSTQLFEQHGDVRAREIIARALTLLNDELQRFGGRLIKTIGDEIMATFPDSENCTLASCNMQKAILDDAMLAHYNIAIRVGFHYGEVLEEKNDVFGDAVNVAARMVGMAKANQIITSRATVQQLPIILATSTRSQGTVNVRGKKEKMEIIEVIWQEDTSDLTMLPRVVQPNRGSYASQLTLHYRNTKIDMQETHPAMVLGREQNNDLSIDEELVSRNHATIEFRQGRFILTDKSTNGTYINTDSGETFFIHRGEIHLHGRGVISLGRDINSADPKLIYFKCGRNEG